VLRWKVRPVLPLHLKFWALPKYFVILLFHSAIFVAQNACN
jgi:hypothetical protein